jgi:hypothetical protein
MTPNMYYNQIRCLYFAGKSTGQADSNTSKWNCTVKAGGSKIRTARSHFTWIWNNANPKFQKSFLLYIYSYEKKNLPWIMWGLQEHILALMRPQCILISLGKLDEFIKSHSLHRAFPSKYSHIIVSRPTRLVQAVKLMTFTRRVRLESRPEHDRSWLRFAVVFSVPPAEYWDNTVLWNGPNLSSASFAIQRLLINLPFDAL